MNRVYVASIAEVGPTAIEELGRVRLRRAVRTDDGRDLPAGSSGTVVAVYGADEAYEVEFTSPFQTEVALAAQDVEAIPGEGRADVIEAAR